MVQIDIISGFLGAGKTTFANRILDYYAKKGFHPVYIVNEFGKTGLDADIMEKEGFTSVEIRGGCVCCTLKGDIEIAIAKVIEQYHPTHIVFEPSGVFVFNNFFEILDSDALKNKCKVGNVITIVDSVNFSFSKTNYGSFLYNQIRNAPVIVLSKLEKSKQDIRGILCDVKNISPGAFVFAKPWEKWTDRDMEAVLKRVKRTRNTYSLQHHSKLKSVTVSPEVSFTKEGIEQILSGVKNGVFGSIYRLKGIVKVDDKWTLVNGINQEVDFSEFWGTAQPSLTFIGKDLQIEQLKSLEQFGSAG